MTPNNIKSMTFGKALDLQLKQLDIAYSQFRSLNADLTVLNPIGNSMTDAKRELDTASEAIFSLKSVMQDASDTPMTNEEPKRFLTE